MDVTRQQLCYTQPDYKLNKKFGKVKGNERFGDLG
jgi:hypothetical protein